MDDRPKIILFIAAIVVLGMPLLGRLVYEEPAPMLHTEVAANNPTLQTLLIQQTQLNGLTLQDTVWNFGGTTILLQPGRYARVSAPDVPMPIQGRWALRGQDLVITAGTRRYEARVVGNQILYNGVPVQRIR